MGMGWAVDKKLAECDKGPSPPLGSTASPRFGLAAGRKYFFFISGGVFSMAISLFDPFTTILEAHIHTAVFSFSLFILLSYRIAVLSLVKTTQLKWCRASDSRAKGSGDLRGTGSEMSRSATVPNDQSCMQKFYPCLASDT